MVDVPRRDVFCDIPTYVEWKQWVLRARAAGENREQAREPTYPLSCQHLLKTNQNLHRKTFSRVPQPLYETNMPQQHWWEIRSKIGPRIAGYESNPGKESLVQWTIWSEFEAKNDPGIGEIFCGKCKGPFDRKSDHIFRCAYLGNDNQTIHHLLLYNNHLQTITLVHHLLWWKKVVWYNPWRFVSTNSTKTNFS